MRQTSKTPGMGPYDGLSHGRSANGGTGYNTIQYDTRGIQKKYMTIPFHGLVTYEGMMKVVETIN